MSRITNKEVEEIILISPAFMPATHKKLSSESYISKGSISIDTPQGEHLGGLGYRIEKNYRREITARITIMGGERDCKRKGVGTTAILALEKVAFETGAHNVACFEANYEFSQLLGKLGYDVDSNMEISAYLGILSLSEYKDFNDLMKKRFQNDFIRDHFIKYFNIREF